jgi:hypothetical protein
VFSFGVMLYEMACGQRPFQGSNTSAILLQVVRKEPRPIEEINRAVPPLLAGLIRDCLEKDEEDRLQSMAEVESRLSTMVQTVMSADPSASSAPRAKRAWWQGPARRTWLAGGAIVALLAATLAFPSAREWAGMDVGVRVLRIVTIGFGERVPRGGLVTRGVRGNAFLQGSARSPRSEVIDAPADPGEDREQPDEGNQRKAATSVRAGKHRRLGGGRSGYRRGAGRCRRRERRRPFLPQRRLELLVAGSGRADVRGRGSIVGPLRTVLRGARSIAAAMVSSAPTHSPSSSWVK